MKYVCRMCGAEIMILSNQSYGTCEFCGSTMAFPCTDSEQRLNLYNRANHYLAQNEYDRAAAMFERIIEMDNNSADAFWGLALAKYGIEYVVDPKTQKRLPTLHRVQTTLFINDTSYKETIKKTHDEKTKEIYQNEAIRISGIQKNILAISAKEAPYDIFICYKETDEYGERTIDSTMAQELYEMLTESHYKVFFARISLEDKLGREYAPYIYAALSSAKVMLVVGTSAQNFTSTWVKNEWSRYLDFIKTDKNKILIPCYKGMDPYEMPEELSLLQGQDMGKIGAQQDILRVVRNKLSEDKRNNRAQAITVKKEGPNVDNLMNRAFLFIEAENYDEGSKYIERVLLQNPSYAPAYIGKLLITYGLKTVHDLESLDDFFEGDSDWKQALKCATKEQKQEYNKISAAGREKRYDKHYSRAIQLKAELINAKCIDEVQWKKVGDMFASLGQFKDCKEQRQDCIKSLDALKKEKREEAKRIEEEQEEEWKRKERAKKITAVKVCLIVAVIIGFIILNNSVLKPNSNYSKAEDLLRKGSFEEAKTIFTALGDFKDSKDKVIECDYRYAKQIMDDGYYWTSYNEFNELIGYKDSESLATESLYLLASAILNNEKGFDAYVAYESSYDLFQQLGDYKDSEELAKKSMYLLAMSYYDDAEYDVAYEYLAQLGHYQGADEFISNDKHLSEYKEMSLMYEDH